MNLTTIQPFGLFPTPLFLRGEESGSSLLADAAHIWAAEDSSGTPSSWLDSGTNPGGYDMSPDGTPNPPTAAGRWDKLGVDLDGVDQFLQYPDAADLRIDESQSVTFSAWVYITSIPGSAEVILAKSGNSFLEYFLAMSSAGVNFQLEAGATRYQASVSGGIVDNSWNHVLCCWDADAGEAYLIVNGGAKTVHFSTTAAVGGAGEAFTIGGRIHASPLYIDAIISEVVMWNRVLTDDEAASLLTASIFDLVESSTPGVTTDEGTVTTDEGTLTTDES